MTDSTIAGPQCGAEIPWTKAVSPRLREQPEAEFEQRRALAKQGKEREQRLPKAIQPTAELEGGVQGLAGREAPREIRALQPPA